MATSSGREDDESDDEGIETETRMTLHDAVFDDSEGRSDVSKEALVGRALSEIADDIDQYYTRDLDDILAQLAAEDLPKLPLRHRVPLVLRRNLWRNVPDIVITSVFYAARTISETVECVLQDLVNLPSDMRRNPLYVLAAPFLVEAAAVLANVYKPAAQQALRNMCRRPEKKEPYRYVQLQGAPNVDSQMEDLTASSSLGLCGTPGQEDSDHNQGKNSTQIAKVTTDHGSISNNSDEHEKSKNKSLEHPDQGQNAGTQESPSESEHAVEQDVLDHYDVLEKALKTKNVDTTLDELNFFCEKIKEREGQNAVQVFPAYKEQDRWKPYILILEKGFSRGSWEKYHKLDVFRRRWDLVSLEAAKVMTSEAVLSNLPDLEEMKRLQQAISSFKDMEKHSNITLVSSCPFRSRKDGEEMTKESCITIHCLVKGFIPFDEEPFPRSLSGVGVDVREGYCCLGMMNGNDVEETMDYNTNSSGVIGNGVVSHSDQTIQLQPGVRANDFNQHLLMGTAVGAAGQLGFGTLGGFVDLPLGEIGFITCAHVVNYNLDLSARTDWQGSSIGRKVVQPSDSAPQADTLQGSRHCGEVVSARFDPGALDRSGVDAALVKLSHRHPVGGEFTAVDSLQLRYSGFSPQQPPTYSRGQILTLDQMTDDQRNMNFIKFGAATGLTRGSLNIDCAFANLISEEMTLPNKSKIRFFNQMEILSHGGKTRFFDLGDSGALIFLPQRQTGLMCVGMAVGCTSYSSCLATPIEKVLKKFNLNKFHQFL